MAGKFKAHTQCFHTSFHERKYQVALHLRRATAVALLAALETWAMSKTEAAGANVALAHPRMARQGEVIPERDLNAEESSTNESHEQTSVVIGTSFPCRARGSNPGPLEIVILQ